MHPVGDGGGGWNACEEILGPDWLVAAHNERGANHPPSVHVKAAKAQSTPLPMVAPEELPMIQALLASLNQTSRNQRNRYRS
jgi:hypothetical protein